MKSLLSLMILNDQVKY